MPDSPGQRRIAVLTAATLLLILVVSLGLRLHAMQESLWLDELHTAWVVNGNWSDVAARAKLGNNGPAYFYLVRGVVNCLGFHSWGLRAVSLVAGIGLILGTYYVTRRWHCSRGASLLGCALVAIDPHAIFFSTEARTYALVQFVSLLHLFWFVELLAGRRRRFTWIWWFVSAVLLFHLHCTTALVLATELCVYLFLYLVRRPPALAPQEFAWAAVLFLLCCLPSWPLLQLLAGRRQNWALFVGQGSIVELFTMYSLSTYVGLPMLCGLAVAGWRRGRCPVASADDADLYRLALLVSFAWLLIPLSSAWCVTQLDWARLFFRRYLVASSASLGVMTALIVSLTLPKCRAVFLVSLIVLPIAALSWRPTVRGEDWRGAVNYVNEDQPSDVPLLFCSGLIESDAAYRSGDPHELAYCAFPLRGLYPLDRHRPLILIPDTTPLRLSIADRAQLQEQGGVLLIRGRRRVDSVIQRVRASLGGSCDISHDRQFGRLFVLRLQPHELETPSDSSQ